MAMRAMAGCCAPSRVQTADPRRLGAGIPDLGSGRDLLEIIEDRYDKGSLIITSQVPVDRWHDMIGIPTLADAILDRIVHNAYRVDLSGESLRKRGSPSKSNPSK